MFFFTLICLCLFALYGVLINYYRKAWNAIPNPSLPAPPPPPLPQEAGIQHGSAAPESTQTSAAAQTPGTAQVPGTGQAPQSAQVHGTAQTPQSAQTSEPVPTPQSSGCPRQVCPASAASPRTRISVLVPARNEEDNIEDCLQSLSRQSYPKDSYEVIVIDDHSTDRTAAIVHEFSGSLPAKNQVTGKAGTMSLRCLSLSDVEAATRTGQESAEKAAIRTGSAQNPAPEPDLENKTAASTGPDPADKVSEHPDLENKVAPARAYKKFAIETGIGAATGELIITTDADCLFHPDWLRTLAGFYEETGAKFMAAPVRIGQAAEPGPGSGRARGIHSFLAIFQTLDFITLQGITGAAVHRKFHSMCNGANLAYEKETFYEVEGFKDIDDIPSGDDMFLMHKIYKKYPNRVFFVKSPQAIVSTRPETSWRGFVNQRVRWASKADKYEDKRIFWVLLLVYLLNLLFIGLLLASWWNNWYLWLLLILLTIKTAVEFPFVRSVAAFFGQRQLMVYFPALQPAHIIYTVAIGWLGKFGSYRWKERTIIK